MFNTSLFDEKTFYKQFERDLLRAEHEVVIESPFIATERMNSIYPLFKKLIANNVKINVITRMPEKHIGLMKQKAEDAIRQFEILGVKDYVP